MLTPNSSGNMQKHGYWVCFHAASTRENISGVCVIWCTSNIRLNRQHDKEVWDIPPITLMEIGVFKTVRCMGLNGMLNPPVIVYITILMSSGIHMLYSNLNVVWYPILYLSDVFIMYDVTEYCLSYSVLVSVVQSGAVVTRSSLSQIYTQHCTDSSRTEFILEKHNRHQIPRPKGRDMGCLLWEFEKNWPCYGGAALF